MLLSGKLWMVGTIFRTGASAPSPCVIGRSLETVLLCWAAPGSQVDYYCSADFQVKPKE